MACSRGKAQTGMKTLHLLLLNLAGLFLDELIRYAELGVGGRDEVLPQLGHKLARVLGIQEPRQVDLHLARVQILLEEKNSRKKNKEGG